MKNLRVGPVTDLNSAIIAIRDLENALQELLGLFNVATPGSVQVMVIDDEGAADVWDLVSVGGVTITKDSANKRFTISAP